MTASAVSEGRDSIERIASAFLVCAAALPIRAPIQSERFRVERLAVVEALAAEDPR